MEVIKKLKVLLFYVARKQEIGDFMANNSLKNKLNKKNKNFYKKSNLNGFTLYEMIISVFIICMCATWILQLFLYSKTLNARANEIDNGSIVLLDAMEISKQALVINKYFNDEFFDGSIIDTKEDYENINIYKAYDENWNPVFLQDKHFDINTLPTKTKYILEVQIEKVDKVIYEKAVLNFVQGVDFATTYGDSAGLKFHIKGIVYDISDKDKTLVDLETVSYFGNNIR